jgi:mono/diheme cytochrome c family protein
MFSALACGDSTEGDQAPPPGAGGLPAGTGGVIQAPVAAAPVATASTTPVAPVGITPVRDAGAPPTVAATSDAGAVANPTQPSNGNGAAWCAARTVFQTRCQTCHGAELAGAPMSLVTWADTQATSVIDKTNKVSELIKARVHDTARPMPPVDRGPLTSQELAALDAWISAGYPNGTCATPDMPAPTTGKEFQWPAECTPDKIFKVQAHENGQPFNVQANWESNVVISIPVPWAGKVSGNIQALAIKPLTNNKRVVHHWILFAGTLDFITSWSPGKPAETFPDDVGVYMPSSGSFSLNMHYYNKGNDSAEQDQSGAEICITNKPRPKTATTNMFGPFLLNIPPGRSEATDTCTHAGTQPITLITSSPHMHKTGVGGKFEIIRANGKVEVLEDSPFNQEDQHVTPINVVVNPGDKVRTTCIYNNTTNQTKTFGESTDDEMCFNFSRYYPMGALSCDLLGL